MGEMDEVITKIRSIREKLEVYLKEKAKREEERAQEINNVKAELEKLAKFVEKNFLIGTPQAGGSTAKTTTKNKK